MLSLESNGESPAIRNAEEDGNGPETSRDPLDIHLSKSKVGLAALPLLLADTYDSLLRRVSSE